MKPTWHSLTHDSDQLRGMNAEELSHTLHAAESYALAGTHGISAVGTLLSCAVLNERMTPSKEALADAGWLIEALGELSSRLSDLQEGTRVLLARFEQEGGQ